MSISDRIERKIHIAAPVSRVWQAISDSAEFSRWFGVTLEGPFVAGQPIRGVFAGELNREMVYEWQRKMGMEPAPIREPDATFCTVERIEPERYFSFRWIPFGIDAAVDPEREPTTLVEFVLEPSGNGTLLTVVESGFDAVPAHRRARAFRMNEGGWTAQVENVRKHVESAA